MDFDDIFADIEDANAEQKEFLANFQETLAFPLFVCLITDTGEIVSSETDTFTGSFEISDAFIGQSRQASQAPVWQKKSGQSLAGIFLESLNSTLFCGVDGGNIDLEFWSQVFLSAVNCAFTKVEKKKTEVENEQLSRQISALQQQHGELVENNHRQYMLLQEKDKDYAAKLESEIALQTAELRKTNEELRAASKLKNEFLANMSHELRTPMNAIIGFSELLVETELNENQAEYAKTIQQSGVGLLMLINDILDFTKIEADKLDIDNYLFKITEVVDNVRAMLAKSAQAKGLKFACRLDPMLPSEVSGDGNRLKQILVNLVGNAIKFTQEGAVVLYVDLGERTKDKVQIRFAIKDTGPGIAADRQSSIFEKFIQEDGSTTRKFGGTGLGLAISSKLVNLMGGEISLSSQVGKGSTFSFTLEFLSSDSCQEIGQVVEVGQENKPAPLVDEVKKQQVHEDFETTSKPIVLLVEDNLVNQRLAAVVLKKQGCEVVVAEDGLVALEKLKGQRVDLVLMDLQMPNMGGLEATKRIRQIEQSEERLQYVGLSDPEKPVLIVGLSAHARKEDAEESLAAGMNEFLTKPIVKAKLEAVIKTIK